jgi:hypothetical protein
MKWKEEGASVETPAPHDVRSGVYPLRAADEDQKIPLIYLFKEN